MQLLFSLFSSNFLSLSTVSTLLLLLSSLFPIYRRLFSNYEKHTFGSEFVNKVRSFSMQKQGRTFCFSTRSALFFLSVLMIYFRFLHLFFHHSLMNSILPQYRAGCLPEAFEIHS